MSETNVFYTVTKKYSLVCVFIILFLLMGAYFCVNMSICLLLLLCKFCVLM